MTQASPGPRRRVSRVSRRPRARKTGLPGPSGSGEPLTESVAGACRRWGAQAFSPCTIAVAFSPSADEVTMLPSSTVIETVTSLPSLI